MKKNGKYILAFVFLVFAIIYCLISLVNHYEFRTYAFDLGMFNQAMYSFSHFKMNYITLNLSGVEIGYFDDHFSIITILLSPFYFIFGSYTLLIIQIISILFGGFGIYKYVSLSYSKTYIPLIITVQFFSIWGIYSALSYDFHTNVLAAMFVPWLLYFYETSNKKYFLLFFILIIFCKENMALWLGFIMVGLILKRIMNQKGKVQIENMLKFEIPLMVISFLYFCLIVSVVMPYISHGQCTSQIARYGLLGDSLAEIISSMFRNPKYIFTLLFESPLKDPTTFGIKSELHFMVLVSGGFALLYRPYYLVMLMPIYAQKLLTNDFVFWGINIQYSIEFVPILTLCFTDFLQKFKSTKLVYGIAIIVTLLTIFYTFRIIEQRKSLWYEKTNTAFYSKIHYTSPLNIKEINKALNTIPDKAIISVNAAIAPHLAFRDKIYHFPVIKNSEYIILLTAKGNTYPLDEQQFAAKINEYSTNGNYVIQYQKNNLLILKKKDD